MVEALSQHQTEPQLRDESMTNNQDTQETRAKAFLEFQENHGNLRAIGRTGEDFDVPGHDWAQWPSEHEETHEKWTAAFKGMPIRNVTGQPSRLLNVHTRKVVRPDQLVQYAAVSYVWGQWEGNLDGMLQKLEGVMKPTGFIFAWIDQECINQTSDADKKTEIKRMREYYRNAAITFVMVPEWSTTFTWELPGFVVEGKQAANAIAEVKALERTVWASRVWTAQEALLSRRVVFVGKSDVKSAVELAVASASFEVSSSGHARVHASWNTGSDGLYYVRVEGATETTTYSSPVAATPILRTSEILTNTNYAQTKYKYLDEIWRITGQRDCKLEEDRVYGMLGLLRGAEMNIEPDIGFEEAVRRAANAGLVSSDILLAETSSQKPGRSWCPRPGTESRIGHSKRRKWDRTTFHQPIELTPEELCKVQGARFQMPKRPEKATKWNSMYCKNLEGGRDFTLDFDSGVPEGEEWRGDWLAVVELEEGGRMPSRATLLKYETQDKGILRKLQTLEAGIWFLGSQYVAKFLLG